VANSSTSNGRGCFLAFRKDGCVPDVSRFLLGLSACAPGTFPSSCNGANPGSTNGTRLSSIIATVLAVRTPPDGIVHGYRVNDANAFVQDDFKVTGRLTFNLGLRWEFDGLSDRQVRQSDQPLAQPSSVGAGPGNYFCNGHVCRLRRSCKLQRSIAEWHSEEFE